MNGKQILQTLDQEDILGEVGRRLLKNWQLFPETEKEIEYWIEGLAEPAQAIATSSLVGNDDEKAISEWIEQSEQEYMRKLLDCIDIRKAKIQMRNPGGNASKGAKTYSMTLPAKWMQEIGITEENRVVTLSFDGKKIIIEKMEE